MKKCKRFPVPRAYFVSTVREKASPGHSAGIAQIEDHLDHVFAPLVGTVPFARRCQLRAELRDRLYALAAEYIAAGRTPDQAVRKAIEGADSLTAIPQKAMGNWWSRLLVGEDSVPIPSARSAFYTAAAWFGAAALLILLFSQGRYPDLTYWNAFLFPLIAGIATGIRSRERPVLGTFYALLALSPASFIAAALIGSAAPAVIAAMIAVVWLPIGCIAAWRAAKYRPAVLAALRRHSGQPA